MRYAHPHTVMARSDGRGRKSWAEGVTHYTRVARHQAYETKLWVKITCSRGKGDSLHDTDVIRSHGAGRRWRAENELSGKARYISRRDGSSGPLLSPDYGSTMELNGLRGFQLMMAFCR